MPACFCASVPMNTRTSESENRTIVTRIEASTDRTNISGLEPGLPGTGLPAAGAFSPT